MPKTYRPLLVEEDVKERIDKARDRLKFASVTALLEYLLSLLPPE
jgi:hypothetical protein